MNGQNNEEKVRDLRYVPAGWQHPKDAEGKYIPLHHDTFSEATAKWEQGKREWDEGLCCNEYERYVPRDMDVSTTYEEYAGARPTLEECMPDWTDSNGVGSQFQYYSHDEKGVPISPPMASERELARWLAGNVTASYADWLALVFSMAFVHDLENDEAKDYAGDYDDEEEEDGDEEDKIPTTVSELIDLADSVIEEEELKSSVLAFLLKQLVIASPTGTLLYDTSPAAAELWNDGRALVIEEGVISLKPKDA